MTMDFDAEYQAWWETKWKEREELFLTAFGQTHPPGVVNAFGWPSIGASVPGGCAMTFPPRPPSRHEWLSISHGLTQPTAPAPGGEFEGPSGYGYEFGFITRAQSAWCNEALGQLLLYVMQSKAPILRGHRVPMWFSRNANGDLRPTIGVVSSDNSEVAFGNMRALLFWPYMRHPRGFSTSTGYFSVLLATTITESEWRMAKQTSSAHLLLLFFRAKNGQVSELDRKTVLDEPAWSEEWEQIKLLSENEAEDLLLEAAALEGRLENGSKPR
jgi:hypothetical protein